MEQSIEAVQTALLTDGEAGFVRQLESVLSRPSRLHSLGQTIGKQVVEDYTWGTHLDGDEKPFIGPLSCIESTLHPRMTSMWIFSKPVST
jgi:hypothetical protein